jgi:hypothetical protein
VSSRRESSVGAARRPSHPPSRRPATRKGGAFAVRCPGLYALLGRGTEHGKPAPMRSPGADPASREPVRGGLATARRGGRAADRRSFDGFCAGVSRSSYSSWCAIHMQPDRRGFAGRADPHRPCISRAPTPHKTQLTCPPSRSLRRNRRARHRTPRIENGHMGCMRPHITSPHMRPRTRPSPTAHTVSHIMLIITGTKR